MARLTCSQLREKDVINLCDGSRLGYISELEFDSCNGQVCSLVLCRGGGLFGFSKESPLVLPWSRIECIGEDAILVKISPTELDGFCKDKRRKHSCSDCDCK